MSGQTLHGCKCIWEQSRKSTSANLIPRPLVACRQPWNEAIRYDDVTVSSNNKTINFGNFLGWITSILGLKRLIVDNINSAVLSWVYYTFSSYTCRILSNTVAQQVDPHFWKADKSKAQDWLWREGNNTGSQEGLCTR